VRDSWIPALMVLGGLLLWWWNPSSSGGIVDSAVDLFSTLVAILRWVLLIGGIAGIVYNIVVWRTAEFAVTNLRVLRSEGLIQKRTSETLLSAVTDVKLTVGVIGGRLGYGDVKVFTQSGDAGADDFTSITQPAQFRSTMMGVKVEEQMARQAPAQAAPAAPAAPVAAVAPAPTVGEQVDDQAERLVKLAELRDQCVITPEEFEVKKAAILSRI
jgi:uncharacterized membrane protein YdbT with pleckstrin-like domain